MRAGQVYAPPKTGTQSAARWAESRGLDVRFFSHTLDPPAVDFANRTWDAEANRTSLSEGTTGKGAEPSMFSEQYDRSLARIQAKDRAYNEGLRSRKEARRAETLERMHRQIRNRKDMEQTVANWT